MNQIIPNKLKKGDKIIVISPSDSLYFMGEEMQKIAEKRFQEMDLEVTYSKNSKEVDAFDSSSIESRVSDLHQAFLDKSIKAIFIAYGGYSVNQLLSYIDWNIIKENPKILMGYSDITALSNAILTKTGLITYSGPTYSQFGQKLYFEYTQDYIYKTLFENKEYQICPSEFWSDDNWYKDQDNRHLIKNQGWLVINEGEAEGKILGGNLSTLNLLQGTEYFPDLTNVILFLEDDNESNIGIFDRDLQSLIHQPNFDKVKALVIGRFQKDSKVTDELLIKSIQTKKELQNIPIIANLDFGHTHPMFVFPIGGKVSLKVSKDKSEIIVKNY